MADFEKEINAIRTVLSALDELSSESRINVLDYVTKRLSIPFTGNAARVDVPRAGASFAGSSSDFVVTDEASETVPPTNAHIKDFKESKRPRSINEMTALVAYYVAELAPLEQRKTTINAKDLATYFKIADYPLPTSQMTLVNAKNAGYLDAVGGGDYKLNAVGHNLVVHTLPRSSTASAPVRRGTSSRKKAVGGRKAATKAGSGSKAASPSGQSKKKMQRRK